MQRITDFGCPEHGTLFLSIYLNDLEDKLYEHCTKCDFKRPHKDRRVKSIPVDKERRR